VGYLNAIGRSDGGHIKNNFGYPVIFFTIFILFNFFYFLEKKFNLLSFNSFRIKTSVLLSILIIAYFSFEIKFQNIYNFQNRLKTYINIEDGKFVTKEYEIFINEVKPILKDEDCVQLFTNNAILSYFLRKKSCTKYYYVWAIGSKKLQDDFINELSNTKFIIADRIEIENQFSPAYRLPHVKKYIDENFNQILSSYKLRVLKRIN